MQHLAGSWRSVSHTLDELGVKLVYLLPGQAWRWLSTSHFCREHLGPLHLYLEHLGPLHLYLDGDLQFYLEHLGPLHLYLEESRPENDGKIHLKAASQKGTRIAEK
jgi:hypothetical protein